MDRAAVLALSLTVIAVGALAPRDWESASFRLVRQANAEQVDPRPHLNDNDLFSAEMVVEAWAQASRSTGPLRLNFTRWEYDEIFGGQEAAKTLQGCIALSGRDYWEFRLGDVETPDEAFIRVGTKLYLAAPAARRLAVFDLEAGQQEHTRTNPPNWLPCFFDGLAEHLDQMGTARFLCDVDSARLRNEFDILVVNVDSERGWIQLELQRRDRDSPLGPRVDVILDRNEMRPVAIQIWQPSGRQRLVYRFEQADVEQTVDVRATLRDWESRYDSIAATPSGLATNKE